MITLHAYPSIYNLGHKAVAEILSGNVLVEEKVDGSQFSFAKMNGNLLARSRKRELFIDSPESMFGNAIAAVQAIANKLHDGWVYRGEYLDKPKHNTIAYDRIPQRHIVIFDICDGLESYLSYERKVEEAAKIGLEVVPIIYYGKVSTLEHFNEMLQAESFLGGSKVEGVVIKRYDLFTLDKKAMMAKYVSESFKEKHQKEWKSGAGKDAIQLLVEELTTEARWQKAVQHLAEIGELESSPRDIGKLIKEIQSDVEDEEKEYVSNKLFQHFWPRIRRRLTIGFPEWYKQELVASAFKNEEN